MTVLGNLEKSLKRRTSFKRGKDKEKTVSEQDMAVLR